ncbi:MAG: hypothetical protein WCT46_06715 [Candidatus Gracilibacteria bacterium]
MSAVDKIFEDGWERLKPYIEDLDVSPSLPKDRMLEIGEQILADHVGAEQHRITVRTRNSLKRGPIDPRIASWARVSSTPGGNRGCFSWIKPPCSYARDGHPCRGCGLSDPTFNAQASSFEDQLAALEDGLSRINGTGMLITTFEFLPDGSFLNDKEISLQVRKGMLRKISQEKNIQRVAIEARPEDCDSMKIRECLSNLREDQTLELYMGLESTNEMVSRVIHNKGYGFDEYKKAVRGILEGLTPDEKKRLHLTVYNMVKPPYLTEDEAINLSVETARDIKAFSLEVGIRIEVKYEPCVITEGTYQHYLYLQGRYTPLSYFSVAEIIARLYEEGLDDMAKFGQRDDIDDYAIPARIGSLTHPGKFSRFDNDVSQAVQRFNMTKDIEGFKLDMRRAIESAECKEWENLLSQPSTLSRIVTPIGSEELTERENFQDKVSGVCNQVENMSSETPDIMTGIVELFREAGILVLMTRDPKVVEEIDNIGLLIEVVIANEEGNSQSVWMKIPSGFI